MAKTPGIRPPPAACLAYARRAPASPKPTDLVAALLEKDPNKRDGMLVAFEGDAGADAAATARAVRAIRAELAPVECADAIANPLLASSSEVDGVSGHALVGLSLAAKLSRTADGAPSLKDATDVDKVRRFIQGPLRTWMVAQAVAIDTLSSAGAKLTGIGRGIAAVESGMADLRLVDRIRNAPVPAGWDAELKAVYEAALDEALEPRKTRGRDAALVGLSDFAAAGIVHDARIDRARALLSKLYGGRRIDALDGLLLPGDEPAAPPSPHVPETVLALVPTRAEGREWFAKRNVTAEAGPRSSRLRLAMGKTYWRRVDFVEAAYAADADAAAYKEKDEGPNARLILALALALAKGPNGAREMMTAPSPSSLDLTHTEALDVLARSSEAANARVAGQAAFDAAHLRSLCPPEGDAAAPHFADVAARFRNAAALLQDPAQRKRAEQRAADAEAAARAQGGGGAR